MPVPPRLKPHSKAWPQFNATQWVLVVRRVPGVPPPPDQAKASWNDDSCQLLLTVTEPPSPVPESIPSSRDQPTSVSRISFSPEMK